LAIASETDLYEPVKRFLESLGYEVRGEVHHCDMVAMRAGEPPVVVELKRTFNLPLLVQGVDRLKHTDTVYVAVEMPKSGRAPHGLTWSSIVRLCRRLGLGLITVRFYKTRRPAVDVLCDPEPYVPRRNKAKTARLLREFYERSGDYNVGGSTGQKRMTAYREKALHCAYMLKLHGPLSPKQLSDMTENPKAPSILQKNYDLWFTRISRGLYGLSEEGERALQQYAHILRTKY